MERTPILAICGSLREHSLHRALLTAVADRAPGFRFVGADLVPDLPLLNPDLDRPDSLPNAVREFRLLAESCRGAVIASPEYVHSPSGVTKNALDWLAGSTGLYGKPVLLMSASPGQTGGLRGLAGLIPTLLALDAILVDPVSVSRALTRIRTDGEVTEVGLDLRLEIAVEQLAEAMSLASGVTVSARS
jgi:chromate reductase, NAD(P)H dehydrogenase (quinone)